MTQLIKTVVPYKRLPVGGAVAVIENTGL